MQLISFIHKLCINWWSNVKWTLKNWKNRKTQEFLWKNMEDRICKEIISFYFHGSCRLWYCFINCCVRSRFPKAKFLGQNLLQVCSHDKPKDCSFVQWTYRISYLRSWFHWLSSHFSFQCQNLFGSELNSISSTLHAFLNSGAFSLKYYCKFPNQIPLFI